MDQKKGQGPIQLFSRDPEGPYRPARTMSIMAPRSPICAGQFISATHIRVTTINTMANKGQ